jgi:fructose-1-phosphate kinase PfkB-like protein
VSDNILAVTLNPAIDLSAVTDTVGAGRHQPCPQEDTERLAREVRLRAA